MLGMLITPCIRGLGPF